MADCCNKEHEIEALRKTQSTTLKIMLGQVGYNTLRVPRVARRTP